MGKVRMSTFLTLDGLMQTAGDATEFAVAGRSTARGIAVLTFGVVR
jgi:hypothetical protein